MNTPKFRFVRFLRLIACGLFLALLLSHQVLATTVSGLQSGTWSLTNSPYQIQGDITVPAGQVLTIEAGVVVQFAGFYRITVLGTLLVIGQPSNRIVFTTLQDPDFSMTGPDLLTAVGPVNNYWNMIEFLNDQGQRPSEMSYCILRYSDAILQIQNAAPILRKLILADCRRNQVLINGNNRTIVQGMDNDLTVVPATRVTPNQVAVVDNLSAANLLQAEEFTFGEIKVVTAARKEQSWEEAPAVMTVITAADIDQRGYKTLLEVLRDVPGFDINDSGNWPDTGIRGVNDRVTYGKHIQYLVDGHDMGFTQFTRNLVAPSWISLSDIKRIEIIRGPGSALWGANAFLGVVNIITKDSEDFKDFELVSQYGTFGTTAITYHGGRKFSEQASFSTSLSFYRDNTSSGRKILEWSKVAGKDVFLTNDKEENYTLHLKARYRDFYLTGHFDRYDPYAPISTFSIGGARTRFITDRKYATLSWEPKIKAINTAFEATYQTYAFGDGAQYEANPFNGELVTHPPTNANEHFVQAMTAKDDFLKLGVRADYNFTPEFWCIGGIEYEQTNSIRWHYPDVFKSDSLNTPKFDVQSYAIFAEGQYKLHPKLTATVGIRYDNHSIFGGVTNPRLGLVWRLPKGFYTKLLYGKAYKAPSLHELYYFRKNAFYGNPDLIPEKIHTSEVLLGYNLSNKVFLNVNYYYSDATDIIGYQSMAAGEPLIHAASFPVSQYPDSTKSYSQQANNQNYELSGVELESKFVLTPQLSLAVNAALSYAKDQKTGARLFYTAEKFLGFQVSYSAFNYATVTLLGRYVGDKLVPPKVYKELGNPYNPKTDETLETELYFVTDLAVNVPKLVNDHFSLSFKINNLTNQEYYDAGRDVLYAQMPRSYLMTVGFKY